MPCRVFLPILVAIGLASVVGPASVVRPASACVVALPNSVIEPILIGGSSGALLAGLGNPGYEIVIRDAFNQGCSNVQIDLDFAGAPPIKLYAAQNAGTTVNCAARLLSKLTDVNGRAVFGPRFGGFVNTASVSVRADGVAIGQVRARSTDIDALGATTGLSDLNLFRVQFFAVQPAAQETDFTGDGLTNLSDLNIFRSEFSSLVVGAYCP